LKFGNEVLLFLGPFQSLLLYFVSALYKMT
jgi:hypothetical protein